MVVSKFCLIQKPFRQKCTRPCITSNWEKLIDFFKRSVAEEEEEEEAKPVLVNFFIKIYLLVFILFSVLPNSKTICHLVIFQCFMYGECFVYATFLVLKYTASYCKYAKDRAKT